MIYHIDDLRTILHNNNWNIVKELDGNDLDISAYWIIEHSYISNSELTISFEGMGGLNVLPIEESYGCKLEENSSISLYFNKNNLTSWKNELQKFMKSINLYLKTKST